MTGRPDPKPGGGVGRIVDPPAVLRGKLAHPWCAACGTYGGNGHHVLPKDRGGDDVEANVVTLCGSGTSGCHGAHHGSPYVVQVGNWCLDVERRDADWVNHRVGLNLIRERPETIAYFVGKLGDRAASVALEELYAIRLDDDGQWRQAPAAAPLVMLRPATDHSAQ